MIDAEQITIWRDDHLLVINKPAGLPTLVDGWHPEAPYLLSILKQRYTPVWVVHRLDRETSGVIIFARTAEAHRLLNRQFETHQVQKTYHAVVSGSPDWDEKEVRRMLRSNGDRHHRTVEDSTRGKHALTLLKVLDRYEDLTLIQATPRTGRTHQIRAHLALAGFPIAGDQLYGDPKANRFERLMLHAYFLCFQHPISGKEMGFEAAYPEGFSSLLFELRHLSG
jgi:RluA family pseudouridine synthase